MRFKTKILLLVVLGVFQIVNGRERSRHIQHGEQEDPRIQDVHSSPTESINNKEKQNNRRNLNIYLGTPEKNNYPQINQYTVHIYPPAYSYNIPTKQNNQENTKNKINANNVIEFKTNGQNSYYPYLYNPYLIPPDSQNTKIKPTNLENRLGIPNKNISTNVASFLKELIIFTKLLNDTLTEIVEIDTDDNPNANFTQNIGLQTNTAKDETEEANYQNTKLTTKSESLVEHFDTFTIPEGENETDVEGPDLTDPDVKKFYEVFKKQTQTITTESTSQTEPIQFLENSEPYMNNKDPEIQQFYEVFQTESSTDSTTKKQTESLHVLDDLKTDMTTEDPYIDEDTKQFYEIFQMQITTKPTTTEPTVPDITDNTEPDTSTSVAMKIQSDNFTDNSNKSTLDLENFDNQSLNIQNSPEVFNNPFIKLDEETPNIESTTGIETQQETNLDTEKLIENSNTEYEYSDSNMTISVADDDTFIDDNFENDDFWIDFNNKNFTSQNKDTNTTQNKATNSNKEFDIENFYDVFSLDVRSKVPEDTILETDKEKTNEYLERTTDNKLETYKDETEDSTESRKSTSRSVSPQISEDSSQPSPGVQNTFEEPTIDEETPEHFLSEQEENPDTKINEQVLTRIDNIIMRIKKIVQEEVNNALNKNVTTENLSETLEALTSYVNKTTSLKISDTITEQTINSIVERIKFIVNDAAEKYALQNTSKNERKEIRTKRNANYSKNKGITPSGKFFNPKDLFFNALKTKIKDLTSRLKNIYKQFKPSGEEFYPSEKELDSPEDEEFDSEEFNSGDFDPDDFDPDNFDSEDFDSGEDFDSSEDSTELDFHFPNHKLNTQAWMQNGSKQLAKVFIDSNLNQTTKEDLSEHFSGLIQNILNGTYTPQQLLKDLREVNILLNPYNQFNPEEVNYFKNISIINDASRNIDDKSNKNLILSPNNIYKTLKKLGVQININSQLEKPTPDELKKNILQRFNDLGITGPLKDRVTQNINPEVKDIALTINPETLEKEIKNLKPLYGKKMAIEEFSNVVVKLMSPPLGSKTSTDLSMKNAKTLQNISMKNVEKNVQTPSENTEENIEFPKAAEETIDIKENTNIPSNSRKIDEALTDNLPVLSTNIDLTEKLENVKNKSSLPEELTNLDTNKNISQNSEQDVSNDFGLDKNVLAVITELPSFLTDLGLDKDNKTGPYPAKTENIPISEILQSMETNGLNFNPEGLQNLMFGIEDLEKLGVKINLENMKKPEMSNIFDFIIKFIKLEEFLENNIGVPDNVILEKLKTFGIIVTFPNEITVSKNNIDVIESLLDEGKQVDLDNVENNGQNKNFDNYFVKLFHKGLKIVEDDDIKNVLDNKKNSVDNIKPEYPKTEDIISFVPQNQNEPDVPKTVPTTTNPTETEFNSVQSSPVFSNNDVENTVQQSPIFIATDATEKPIVETELPSSPQPSMQNMNQNSPAFDPYKTENNPVTQSNFPVKIPSQNSQNSDLPDSLNPLVQVIRQNMLKKLREYLIFQKFDGEDPDMPEEWVHVGKKLTESNKNDTIMLLLKLLYSNDTHKISKRDSNGQINNDNPNFENYGRRSSRRESSRNYNEFKSGENVLDNTPNQETTVNTKNLDWEEKRVLEQLHNAHLISAFKEANGRRRPQIIEEKKDTVEIPSRTTNSRRQPESRETASRRFNSRVAPNSEVPEKNQRNARARTLQEKTSKDVKPISSRGKGRQSYQQIVAVSVPADESYSINSFEDAVPETRRPTLYIENQRPTSQNQGSHINVITQQGSFEAPTVKEIPKVEIVETEPIPEEEEIFVLEQQEHFEHFGKKGVAKTETRATPAPVTTDTVHEVIRHSPRPHVNKPSVQEAVKPKIENVHRGGVKQTVHDIPEHSKSHGHVEEPFQNIQIGSRHSGHVQVPTNDIRHINTPKHGVIPPGTTLLERGNEAPRPISQHSTRGHAKHEAKTPEYHHDHVEIEKVILSEGPVKPIFIHINRGQIKHENSDIPKEVHDIIPHVTIIHDDKDIKYTPERNQHKTEHTRHEVKHKHVDRGRPKPVETIDTLRRLPEEILTAEKHHNLNLEEVKILEEFESLNSKTTQKTSNIRLPNDDVKTTQIHVQVITEKPHLVQDYKKPESHTHIKETSHKRRPVHQVHPDYEKQPSEIIEVHTSHKKTIIPPDDTEIHTDKYTELGRSNYQGRFSVTSVKVHPLELDFSDIDAAESRSLKDDDVRKQYVEDIKVNHEATNSHLITLVTAFANNKFKDFNNENTDMEIKHMEIHEENIPVKKLDVADHKTRTSRGNTRFSPENHRSKRATSETERKIILERQKLLLRTNRGYGRFQTRKNKPEVAPEDMMTEETPVTEKTINKVLQRRNRGKVVYMKPEYQEVTQITRAPVHENIEPPPFEFKRTRSRSKATAAITEAPEPTTPDQEPLTKNPKNLRKNRYLHKLRKPNN